MVFLIRDSFILAVGTKYDNEDIIKVFRDEVGRILSTSCTVYIDDQPINDTLPKTFPEKVDALVYYLLQGTTVFKFRWHGPHGQVNSESVIHLQRYEM
jgi:hypothetical protein